MDFLNSYRTPLPSPTIRRNEDHNLTVLGIACAPENFSMAPYWHLIEDVGQPLHNKGMNPRNPSAWTATFCQLKYYVELARGRLPSLKMYRRAVPAWPDGLNAVSCYTEGSTIFLLAGM